MKLGELKVIHIIILIGLLLWGYLFYDMQMVKYQMQFTNWQGQVTQAINNLVGRVDRLEGINRNEPLKPPSVPRK